VLTGCAFAQHSSHIAAICPSVSAAVMKCASPEALTGHTYTTRRLTIVDCGLVFIIPSVAPWGPALSSRILSSLRVNGSFNPTLCPRTPLSLSSTR